MPCVKGLDLGFYAQIGHHFPHGLQHTGRIGHDVIRLSKVHRATIQRTDFWQTFRNMGHALFRADHIGACLT